MIEGYCCLMCAKGTNKHGSWCLQVDSNEENWQELIKERNSKKEKKPCQRNILETKTFELDESKKPEKCGNCNMISNGIHGFCCKRCAKEKGNHGHKCLKIDNNSENWQEVFK